jgi:two-component system, NtrC family, nitrogen regulation sensor histidine kinase GlnL
MNQPTPIPKNAEIKGSAAQLLEALPHALIRVSADETITYANSAAEHFFRLGAPVLAKMTIEEILPEGNPMLSVIRQVLVSGHSLTEYALELSTPRTDPELVDIQVVPISDDRGTIAVMIQRRSIAQQIDRQLTHRGAARSVMGMAAMMAHEIKNPLSGIKGAAQLLEPNVSPLDAELTKLICDETDRIASLVDRMEIFSDHRPAARNLVNIHDVLDHVRKIAMSGWGNQVQIVEDYDPSLPPVLGDRDQLVQVFLNLTKNAVEALATIKDKNKELVITLSTAYRPGVRMVIPGAEDKVDLPLEVSVSDNGPGISGDIVAHMFEPFVSTKINGSGLGLALVAKIIGDHGGVIECNSGKGRTIFKTRLPIQKEIGVTQKERGDGYDE